MAVFSNTFKEWAAPLWEESAAAAAIAADAGIWNVKAEVYIQWVLISQELLDFPLKIDFRALNIGFDAFILDFWAIIIDVWALIIVLWA